MFHETLPVEIYEIIAAIMGVTISGWFLLRSHHNKIKEELEIHREKEVFNRKQIMYRTLVNYFLELLDLKSNTKHERGNWRIGNYLYTELLLIGGKPVITAFTIHLKAKLAGTDNDIEHSNKIKDILVGIREDLYHHKLDRDEINFIQPTQETYDALEIIEESYSDFEKFGLTTLEKASKMNVEQIANETSIPKEKLEFLKKIALTEKKIYDEFTDYLNNLILNNDPKTKEKSL